MYRREKTVFDIFSTIAQMEIIQSIPTMNVDQGNSKNSTIDLIDDLDFDT